MDHYRIMLTHSSVVHRQGSMLGAINGMVKRVGGGGLYVGMT